MYTLILTLSFITVNNYPTSTTIEHIDGFNSMASCQAAGNAWLKTQKNDDNFRHKRVAQAICIRKY